MPYQCVHCSKIIETGSREILDGCSNCGGRFFFYINEEQLEKIKNKEESEPVLDMSVEDKKRIEKDAREILDIEEETKPVILDLESIRTLGPGKFEIDIVSLMNRKPIIFKVHEGKYLIDIERI